MAMVLIAAMAWEDAFKKKALWPKMIFGLGAILSLWMCISAQLTSTAPYASALGLEDSLKRLKRHYSFNMDTYSGYKTIELNSDTKDKTVAFAVFQTYPFHRTAFVDFKWKKPIFLQWASGCKTAEQLAEILRKEGVDYFLYQRWEATAMSKIENDFNLVGMPVSEYVRFWQYFAEPTVEYENTFVYHMRHIPLSKSRKLRQLPGLEEKGFWFYGKK
jgi:hypothetical protein